MTATRGQRSMFWGILAMVATCLVSGLIHVWTRLQVTKAGYELSAVRNVVEKLDQEKRTLAIELATLTSPSRLEEMARKRLGMERPHPHQIVVMP